MTTEVGAVLDDSASPVLIGSEREEPIGRDERLVLQVERSQVVASGVVATVSRSALGGETSLQVTLRLTSVLAGRWDGDTLVLEIRSQAPAFEPLRSLESELVGRKLIVLAGRFSAESGVVTRFRLEDDSEEVRKAIEKAKDLQPLRKR